jgi:Domain of unknown function (DUF6475)
MEAKIRPEEFAVELQALAQGFYDRTLADETVFWYYEDLCMYDLQVLHAALRKHVNTPGECKFFPKPGQIKALIEVPVAELATSAWMKLDKLIRTAGRYHSVKIEDEIAAEVVISMGGWVQLCSSATDREHDMKRVEFIKRYEGLKTRIRVNAPRAVAMLPGMVEQARAAPVLTDKTETRRISN